jgi:hypothetical protein
MILLIASWKAISFKSFVDAKWLALSKGPNRAGVFPPPEDGNRSSFQNVVFSSF